MRTTHQTAGWDHSSCSSAAFVLLLRAAESDPLSQHVNARRRTQTRPLRPGRSAATSNSNKVLAPKPDRKWCKADSRHDPGSGLWVLLRLLMVRCQICAGVGENIFLASISEQVQGKGISLLDECSEISKELNRCGRRVPCLTVKKDNNSVSVQVSI